MNPFLVRVFTPFTIIFDFDVRSSLSKRPRRLGSSVLLFNEANFVRLRNGANAEWGSYLHRYRPETDASLRPSPRLGPPTSLFDEPRARRGRRGASTARLRSEGGRFESDSRSSWAKLHGDRRGERVTPASVSSGLDGASVSLRGSPGSGPRAAHGQFSRSIPAPPPPLITPYERPPPAPARPLTSLMSR